MVRSADDDTVEDPGLLESMRRYPVLVVLAIQVFAGIGVALSLLQPAVYTATAQLYLADPRTQAVLGSAGRVTTPEDYVPQQADRVTARTVLDQAADDLGDVTTASLRERLTVTGDADLNLIGVTATGPSADDAAEAANAVASSYMAFAEERIAATAEQTVVALQERIDELNAEIDDLEAEVRADPEDVLAQSRLDVKLAQLNQYEARITDVTVQTTTYGSGVDQFEPAEPPRTPTGTSPVTFGVLGGFIGLILAASVAYWRAGRTTVLLSPHHPTHILNAPLLGEIPVRKKVEDLSTDPSIMDHYGFLLASLDFELRAVEGRTILVTSAEEGEGKTTTAVNLALAAASGGRRAALVDGDLRRRSMSKLLGLGRARGIIELAEGDAAPTESLHATTVASERLTVLPSGTGGGEAGRVLRSRQFADAVQALRQDVDLVVVDSAPLLAVPDTSVLAGQLDGVVVVIRSGRAKVPDLQQLRDRLSFVTAPLLGYVWITNKPTVSTRYDSAYEHAAPNRSSSGRTPDHQDRARTPEAWGASRPPERRS